MQTRTMTSYAFINNILHVAIEGPTTIADLLEFLDDFGSMEELPSDLKLFYDLRNAQLDLKLEEISTLSEKAMEKTAGYTSVKTAFCVKDPKITAYTMLFSWLPKTTRVTREQFSTKKAALEWLNAD